MSGNRAGEITVASRLGPENRTRVKLLTPEREFALARAWRDDEDEEALHELITAYAPLVFKISRRYRHYGLAMCDLVQEGNIGLLLAASRFEPEREFRFSTYASWWIRSTTQEFVLRNWSIVRTGTTSAQKALFFNLRRLRAKHIPEGEDSLTPESRREIAKELKVRVVDVETMDMRLSRVDQSLNAKIGDSSDDQWQDLLADQSPSPEDAVVAARTFETRSRWLAIAMAELTSREHRIITRRQLREKAVTLEALGVEFGISKERVRQIEHNALEKLRVAMGRFEHGRPPAAAA
ncbi:MAG: RNA polymerase factor sigma-32 [Alphaproteobacteria bacterium]|nr:RNA polymerase factor sigma-32 [Alphaproteobacteria bacterium]MDP6516929.1 RNA polymerase factor sigma-32 [Alphaproteobacteria bacterium]